MKVGILIQTLENGRVRAHTLPQPSASTRVLTKCGFRHIGAVIDPEDGLVWRWEKYQEAAGDAAAAPDTAGM